jgi:hypothetical protein
MRSLSKPAALSIEVAKKAVVDERLEINFQASIPQIRNHLGEPEAGGGDALRIGG